MILTCTKNWVQLITKWSLEQSGPRRDTTEVREDAPVACREAAENGGQEKGSGSRDAMVAVSAVTVDVEQTFSDAW